MPCWRWPLIPSIRDVRRVDVDLGDRLLEAHPRRPAQEAHRPAGGDHRLRRDAVPQVGGAADDVALDHRDVGAEPGGVGGRRVAGRSAADDHEACGHGVRLGLPVSSEVSAPLYGERPVDQPTADPADADGAPHGRERAGRRAGAAPGAGRRAAPGRARTRTRTASTAPTPSPRCAPRWAELEPGTETDDEVAVAGRVLLQRDTGKLVFATIAERGAEVQLFMSKAVVGDESLRRGQGARPRRLGRRPRHGDDHPHGRAVGEGRPARPARQVDPPAARQVARPHRSRHAVPPALRRPHRQRRRPAGVRRAPRRDRQLPPHAARARLRRGRDAGPARRRRRRPRPPVRDPPQHARHAALPPRRRSSCTSSG